MKRNVKRLLAALLLGTTILTSACGSAGAGAGESQGAQSEATASETAQAAADTEGKTLHPCRIVQPGNLPADYDKVIAEVNRRLLEDGYDIEVEVIRFPWDVYSEKLNLWLSSGEKFELLHVMQDVKNLSSIAKMGAIVPIDEYLDKYPDLKDRFRDVEWKAGELGGEHYAVPCTWRMGPFGADGGLSVREDVFEAMDREFPQTKEEMLDLFGDMQQIMLEETGIKAYHWQHSLAAQPSWLHRTYDTYPFYVETSLGLVMVRQDGTVDSFYESEEFENDAKFYKELYDNGFIYPDILSTNYERKYDDMYLGAWLPSETFTHAYESTLRKNIPEASIKYYFMGEDKPHFSYQYTQNLNAVSSTAEDPESGIKFLDWLYKSQENYELFHFGFEGEHWHAIGDDRYEYVLGDDGNPLYAMDEWMTGYKPYMRFESGISDDGVEYNKNDFEDVVMSPVTGFVFDASNVTSELSSLETEIIASIYPIKYGVVSYDDNIDAAIANLKAAGLDKYLEEYRTQLAAFIAENGGAE